MANLSPAVPYVLQLKGVLVARDQIAEILGSEWLAFRQQLEHILAQIAAAEDAQLRRLVDDLMKFGLQTRARDLFREIGRKSLAVRPRPDGGMRVLRLDSIAREVRTTSGAGMSDVRQAADELLQAITTAMVPKLPEVEPASYVNFAFTDVTLPTTLRNLPINEGFVAGGRYRMTVSIGLTPDERFAGPEQQPAIEHPSGEKLYVAVFLRGPTGEHSVRLVSKRFDTMVWPQGGPSTKSAEFVLEADETFSQRTAVLDMYIYYQTHLLYTARLRITVQPQEYEWAQDERPITWVYRDDDERKRSRLFRQFTALNRLAPRALNLAIQAGDSRDEYLLTAFIGRAEFPARLTMTRDELNGHLLEVRRVLDDLRKERVYLQGGYTQQGDYVGDYTGKQGCYTKQREPLDAVEATGTFNRFMDKIAQLGSRFYDDLFKGNQEFREAIEQNLATGDAIQIWIDRDASDFVYPWAWLYRETIDPARRYVLQKDSFWGYRHIIEQVPQFRETVDKTPAPNELPAEPLNVKIGVWNFDPTTKTQRAFFAQCESESAGMLHYEIWEQDRQWEAYLPQCDSQILYFFSHGHTAKPTSLASLQFYDMVASMKQWTAQPLEGESVWMQQYRRRMQELLQEFESNQSLLSETYIRLQKGYLLLRELRRQMNLQQTAPLVFLNMCESAQVFPNISEGLIDLFLKTGARSVIGTEIPMIDAFADLFSRRFFHDLFSQPDTDEKPENVGTILFNLRRAFLDIGNPLSFAYTLFGNADTRLSRPLISSTCKA